MNTSHDHDQLLCDSAHRIAQIVAEYFRFLSIEMKTSNVINPYGYQTTDGILLEVSYSLPSKLWLPWGTWKCWSGGRNTSGMLIYAIPHLQLRNFRPRTRTSLGMEGPVYVVECVQGISLPSPTLRSYDEKLSPEECLERWKSLCARHEAFAST